MVTLQALQMQSHAHLLANCQSSARQTHSFIYSPESQQLHGVGTCYSRRAPQLHLGAHVLNGF